MKSTCFTLLIIHLCKTENISLFHRLLEDLLNGYQKLERPVAEEGQALQLNFSLALQQIIDLDEKNQLLKTNIWLTFNWYDVNLKWNEVNLLDT